jgi:putative transposase
MWNAFIFLLALLVRVIRSACKSRDELMLENLALRQQVAARKLGKYKPELHEADRASWLALRKTWANWASRLVIVKPETVVDWQRRRFRRHWTRISQQGRHPGRPAVGAEIRDDQRQLLLPAARVVDVHHAYLRSNCMQREGRRADEGG